MYILCTLSIQKASKRIVREEISLQPHKYGFQDYIATEEKWHTKYKDSYEQVFLCTTETTDPVQWIEQLYTEDVG